MNNAFRVPLRAQGGMPEYRSQTIGPEAGANVSARYDDRAAGIVLAQANRNAQADAQGWDKFNRGLQTFLYAGNKLYAQYQDQKGRGLMTDALISAREQFEAWRGEYDKTHQGGLGLNAEADYDKKWHEITQATMKGLREKGMPQQYVFLTGVHLREHGLHYNSVGRNFQRTQDKAWGDNQLKTLEDEIIRQAQADPGNLDAVNYLIGQRQLVWQSRNPGLDGAAEERRIQEAAAVARIQTKIAAGDTAGAASDVAMFSGGGGINNGHSIAEDHNNPLNEKSPGKNTGTRGDFKVYASVEDGLRGNWELLQRYQSRHNRRTLREIITRWAPPSENRTAQYIANVSQKAGIGADVPVNMKDIPTAARVIKAMAEEESPLGKRLTVPQIEAALKGENAKRPAMYVAYDNPEGMTEQGNIDIANRPQVKTEDGGTATVRSMSVNFDGAEVLLPTVSQDGRLLSEAEAIAEYKKTGKHLGKFDTPEHASTYAQKLHEQQEKMYLGSGEAPEGLTAQGGQGAIPAQASGGMRILSPDKALALNNTIRAANERQQKQARLAAAQQVAGQLRGLPAEEREAVVYKSLAEISDPEARKEFRTMLDDQLAFYEKLDKAEAAVQGRKIAAQLKGKSLLERNQFFTDNNISPQAQKIAIQQLDNNLETSPVAMSQAKDDILNGAPLEDISARYGALISANGMEELRTFAASEERKGQHKKLSAFMSEMIAQSGMDMKNEDDKEYILGIKAEFEEAFNAGQFKRLEDQKNWIYERLARRRAPGMFWGENEYSPRKAAGRQDAYIPVPAWAEAAIRRQIFREKGISNPTQEQIQAVYNDKLGMARKPETVREEDIPAEELQYRMSPVDGSIR